MGPASLAAPFRQWTCRTVDLALCDASGPDRLTLPERGDNVALWRDGGEVAMAAVDDASFACVGALAQAATVDAAIAAARALDPTFDPEACVFSLAEHTLITGLHERLESAPCPHAI